MATIIIEQHLVFQKYKTLDVKVKTLKDAFDYCDNVYKRIIKKNKKAAKDWRPNAYGHQSLPGFKINGKYYQSQFDEIDQSDYVPKNQIIKRP
jgi:hypothetical protein